MDYYKLDEKDIVILENLANDSRLKLSTLANMLSTSIPTIRSRIDKLVALGIIQKFTIILSYELLSENPSYFILLSASPKSINGIIDDISRSDIVLEVHELIGTFQIQLKTIPISMKDFQAFLNKLRSVDGINDINTMPIATTYKQDIAKLPSQDIQVKLRCELISCGKQIEKDFQTISVNDVTHFFCCKSCLANYQSSLPQVDITE